MVCGLEWLGAGKQSSQGTREKVHWGGNNLCKKEKDVKALSVSSFESY